MARWQIVVSGKGIRKDSVQKIVDALAKKFDGAVVSVTDATPPESRADRLADAQSMIGEARSEYECLRDELQEWKDGLPENLSQGSKADELDEAITALEEHIDALDNVENGDVTFPGMY